MFGKSLAGAHQTCNYTSLNGKNIQQKYRNRISEWSFSPLPASISAIISHWYKPERNDLYLGQGKTRQSTSYNFSFLQYYVQF